MKDGIQSCYNNNVSGILSTGGIAMKYCDFCGMEYLDIVGIIWRE